MKVVDIEANLPHKVSEVMCVNCLHRWLSVYPEETLLKDLECPECSEVGYVICTGQNLEKGGESLWLAGQVKVARKDQKARANKKRRR